VNPFEESRIDSAHRAARRLNGLFTAYAVLGAVCVVSDILELGMVMHAAAHGITHEQAVANDSRQQVLGVAQILLLVGTCVAFLVWIFRSFRNLTALGNRELKYSPGRAVGGFLIPFLNIVRPLPVMRELWHASDPDRLEQDLSAEGPAIRNQLGTPLPVSRWWAIYLLYGFVGNVVFRMGMIENPTLSQIQASSMMSVLSDMVGIASAILAARVVSRIDLGQQQRWERIRAMDPRPAATFPSLPTPVG